MSRNLFFPADKSLFHRAVLFSGLVSSSKLFGRYIGRDNLASIRVMRQLGLELKIRCNQEVMQMMLEESLGDVSTSNGGHELTEVSFSGGGLRSLSQPDSILYCGNSGTTSRMIMGMLAALPFKATLDGDKSLRRRPFARVVNPLKNLGAKFSSDMLPITVTGNPFKNDVIYDSPVSSAQVKSCMLLSAITSGVGAKLTEPTLSRDHSERLLNSLGYKVTTEKLDNIRVIYNPKEASPVDCFQWTVPGDLSAASFFLVLAAIQNNLGIKCCDVLYNESRVGILDVLDLMGADLKYNDTPLKDDEISPECSKDIWVNSAALNGIEISDKLAVRAIDEIPIICVAALFAKGKTSIRDVKELRVKESDRIEMMKKVIEDVGGKVLEYEDGLDIYGVSDRSVLRPLSDRVISEVDSCGDHRIIMSSVILNYIITGQIKVINPHEIETSFPNFYSNLNSI